MECDPTRVCELLVGLGDVEVLGVDDEAGGPLRVHIRRRAPRTGVRALRRGRCGLTASGRWSWWTCRRSGDRRGWSGTSGGGAAPIGAVGRARSPSRTLRSRRRGRS